MLMDNFPIFQNHRLECLPFNIKGIWKISGNGYVFSRNDKTTRKSFYRERHLKGTFINNLGMDININSF